jgi:3-oxoacyl-[acyl-carrier protein] reductase
MSAQQNSGQPLAGKTALVIGGSRGIGRAVVERFAADGASVVFSYVQREPEATALADMVARTGGSAIPVRADLGHTDDIRKLFDAAEKALGGLDIVVVNAAIAVIKPMVDLTEADFDRVFGVNAKGSFVALQEAAPRTQRWPHHRHLHRRHTDAHDADIPVFGEQGRRGAVRPSARP